MSVQEFNLDGLIGPTHCFGGLGVGNIASAAHAGQVSRPRAAALQGLNKMRLLHERGVGQMVMPPHPRPALSVLREQGVAGTTAQMLVHISSARPEMLPLVYSSSAMWAANAATVSPSRDTADHHIHFTPANLISNPHRRIEAPFTAHLLKRLFPGERFVHHPPLPAQPDMADEGAANHMHVRPLGQEQGVDIFVYGAAPGALLPTRYPARQQRQAQMHIARQHGLSDARTLFVQQSPQAIDAGVFHNDVIAMSCGHVVLYHEDAFADEAGFLAALDAIGGVNCFRVDRSSVSLDEAVASYLFNSQIVRVGDGMLLVAPRQCEQLASVQGVIERWLADDTCPIDDVLYVDVDQSMANGGGPACLRLRVWMNEAEIAGVHQAAILTPYLYESLKEAIHCYYPETLGFDDLRDPDLAARVAGFYHQVEQIMQLPGLYDGWL